MSNSLLVSGYARHHQIGSNPLTDLAVPPIVPVRNSNWWNGVKAGRFPAGEKLGPRITAWRTEDIRVLIAKSLEV